MAKISILIPVYNVELYLEECLNSVIHQTEKDLEIICVDDASTDQSLKILKNMLNGIHVLRLLRILIIRGCVKLERMRF